MASNTANARQSALQSQYNIYKTQLNQLSSKISDLELESEEHRLVLDTITPLASSPSTEKRKCYRMINGVLVERTVKDVLPGLKANSEGLDKVLGELGERYKKLMDEVETWKKKNNVQIVQQ